MFFFISENTNETYDSLSKLSLEELLDLDEMLSYKLLSKHLVQQEHQKQQKKLEEIRNNKKFKGY